MPHRYAWLVGGCADDCHEPDELFARTSLRHSASIAPKTFPVTFPRESARIAPPRFSHDIATSFSRDIHLARGPALSGHCEAGGLSQWKHFPSICTANMPHRYAWLVGGCADDCHEPEIPPRITAQRDSLNTIMKNASVFFYKVSVRILIGDGAALGLV